MKSIKQAIQNANRLLDESASWNNFNSGSFNPAADRHDRLNKGDEIDKLIAKFEKRGYAVFRYPKKKTISVSGREMPEKEAVKKMKRILREETELTEKNEPKNPALWQRAIAKAKSKFDVYPSAYANAWAAKWYKSQGGSWEKVSEGKRGLDDKSVYSDSGLGKWAKQDWVDISRKDKDGKHPSCGRKDADGSGYPKCRPAKSASKMSSKEKKSAVSRKRDVEARDRSNPKGDKPNMVKTKLGEEKNEGKPLNKPFRTPDGPKKFAVYVKNASGKTVIVRFGDPNMSIKKNQPARKKSFDARHKCDQKKDKTTAGYWSCKAWEERLAESTLTKNTSMLKSAGFNVRSKSGEVSANKYNPDKKDLETAISFMKKSGFVEKQRFGKIHTNLNIVFDHPTDNETGFINFMAGSSPKKGSPNGDEGEIFLNAGV